MLTSWWRRGENDTGELTEGRASPGSGFTAPDVEGRMAANPAGYGHVHPATVHTARGLARPPEFVLDDGERAAKLALQRTRMLKRSDSGLERQRLRQSPQHSESHESILSDFAPAIGTYALVTALSPQTRSVPRRGQTASKCTGD